ncbi:MAG: nitrilase-related carbon-nitrogen hydrolase [Methanomicrobiales archaeon]|nr:nitrilase-related carbon-nitrogen hydrolase [Methanomicrobiales archaeon]MDI6875839.1 nitrilase-related carbon-nitrogen hydrolase [Methanomicrobiales archaeon]
MSVRVCIAQFAFAWEDPDRALVRAEGMVRQAAERGAALIAFPEQFATGWSPRSAHSAEGIDGRIVSTLRRYAGEYGIAILGSFPEAGHPLPRNTCVAIGADGALLGTYAKIHLFSPGGEPAHYAAGERLLLFTVGGVRFGVAICYDLRFPELFRLYAEAGAECVLVPAAWPCSRIEAWELLLRVRALENQFYAGGINGSGETPVDRYCGGSVAADPVGSVLVRGGAGEEQLDFSVDPAAVARTRRRMPVERDRREDVYLRLRREWQRGGR